MFPKLTFIQSLVLGTILIISAFLVDYYNLPQADFLGGLLGGIGAGIIFFGFINRNKKEE
ncbi:MAG: hypothetical protein V4585_08460 [Bacteroidota bacterium]|jgi:hypothetical protein